MGISNESCGNQEVDNDQAGTMIMKARQPDAFMVIAQPV
jgi:hypothetical protein